MKNLLLSTSSLLCLCALLMSWTPTGLNGKETVPDPGNSQIVPLDQTFWIPCANGGAGEYVRFTGTLQVVSFVKTDANGGRHLHVHEQPQNVTGLGLTTGAEFRGTGTGGFTLNIKADNTGNYTAVTNFLLIGKGQTPSLKQHFLYHITVNANGEVSVVVSLAKTSCE